MRILATTIAQPQETNKNISLRKNQGIAPLKLNQMPGDSVSFGNSLPSINQADNYIIPEGVKQLHLQELILGHGFADLKDATVKVEDDINALWSVNSTGDVKGKNISARGLNLHNAEAEEAIESAGELNSTGTIKAKNVYAKHAKLTNANVSETLKAWGLESKGMVKAKNIVAEFDANLNNAVIRDTLETQSLYSTGTIKAGNIDLSVRGVLTNVIAGTLRVGEDLNIDTIKANEVETGGFTDIKKVNIKQLTLGDNLYAGTVKRLRTLVLTKNPHKHQRNRHSRALTFEKPETLSRWRKTKVFLDESIQELTIYTPDGDSSVLKRLNFFRAVTETVRQTGEAIVTKGAKLNIVDLLEQGIVKVAKLA